jgi:hypothetical protein
MGSIEFHQVNPVGASLLSTHSSFKSFTNMNSTDDHTSGTIVPNPFFTEKALASSTVPTIQTLAVRTGQKSNHPYHFPALYNPSLGLYMALSVSDKGAEEAEYCVFSSPNDLCYYYFSKGVCTPPRGKTCPRRHVKHADFSATVPNQEFGTMLLAEYHQQLINEWETFDAQPAPGIMPGIHGIMDRPMTPAAVNFMDIQAEDEMTIEMSVDMSVLGSMENNVLALRDTMSPELATIQRPRNSVMDAFAATFGVNCPERATPIQTVNFMRDATPAPMPAPRNSDTSGMRSENETAERIKTLGDFETLYSYLQASRETSVRALLSNKLLVGQLKSYMCATGPKNVMQDKAKTNYCSHWMLYKTCPFENCTFAHGAEELRPDLSQFINIIVLMLLKDKVIDMQMVIESLVSHFIRDDIIELVDATFDCLNRYTQKSGKKAPFGIYVDENCLSRMLFERTYPRTNPKKGLNKEYLPHLLTMHRTLFTFLTSPELKAARAEYKDYNFVNKWNLLDMKDSNGFILRDTRSGLPVSDIVTSLVWGYNQCSKNRRFPYYEMALTSMSSQYVRTELGRLPAEYRPVVEELFSLEDYCMAGHMGCKHGSHTIYGRTESESFVQETLLNLNGFFGITEPTYDAAEFKRLSDERDRLMDEHYQAVEELFRILNDYKLDMDEYAQFMDSSKATKGDASKIAKLVKTIETTKKQLAEFVSLRKKNQKTLEEEIRAFDDKLEELSGMPSDVEVRAEMRRVHSMRAVVLRTLKEFKKLPDTFECDSKVKRLEKDIDTKETELAQRSERLNSVSSTLDRDVYFRLNDVYRRIHGINHTFKATTAAWLKVAPRPGNCVVKQFKYQTLVWWSDNASGSSTAGIGIECVPQQEAHKVHTNDPSLAAPLPAAAIMPSLAAAVGMDALAWHGASSSQMALSGPETPKVSSRSDSSIVAVTTSPGGGMMTERTGARAMNDQRVAQELAQKGAVLTDTSAFPKLSPTAHASAGVLALPSSAELYSEIAEKPASAKAIAAEEAAREVRASEKCKKGRGRGRRFVKTDINVNFHTASSSGANNDEVDDSLVEEYVPPEDNEEADI